MSEVRKHRRRTASGRMTTVRKHWRNMDGQDDPTEAARQAWQDRASAPHVASLDSGNRIPDPDDPANAGWMATAVTLGRAHRA